MLILEGRLLALFPAGHLRETLELSRSLFKASSADFFAASFSRINTLLQDDES
jgi:hypothetical protein